METKSVAHFRTGIGNFVLYTPALQAIASMDPSGKIDIATDPDWHDFRKGEIIDLWERLPYVNKVMLHTELNLRQYTTWLWSMWTTCGEGRRLFQRKKFYEPPEWDQNVEHESEYYMRLVRAYYGYKGETPKQHVTPADGPTLNLKGRSVLFCNGGYGDIKVFKSWPAFNELSVMIKKYFDDVTTIKIGFGEELSNVDADIDFVGKLTLSETARVIQQADIMVTTDTGNMHIADALGIPLIVLWGGSSVPKNKPINSKAKIVHLGLDCQPCQAAGAYRGCKDLSCMNNITVGEIMYHIRTFFNKGNFDE